MSVNINDIRHGDIVRMTAGGLSDEGPVVEIDYEDHVIYFEADTSNGVGRLDVDPDEPGLELVKAR